MLSAPVARRFAFPEQPEPPCGWYVPLGRHGVWGSRPSTQYQVKSISAGGDLGINKKMGPAATDDTRHTHKSHLEIMFVHTSCVRLLSIGHPLRNLN